MNNYKIDGLLHRSMKLKEIRRERCISLYKIENDIQIPSQKLIDFENGKEQLYVDELVRLIDYYNLTYDQVLHYNSNKRVKRIIVACIVALFVLASGTIVYKRLLVNHHHEVSAENRRVEGDINKTNFLPPPLKSNDAENNIKAENNENNTDKVTFRFWGNIQYDISNVPKIEDSHENKVIDVIPIEKLSNKLPAWLQEKDRDKLILNVGTSDIWTSSTLEAFQNLREDKYNILGLGRTPDVYSPFILEVNSKKIGFLSLTGLIHNQNEIAVYSRIGLPSAYVENEVIKYVKDAKEKVDYLFVLIDWGKTWSNKHNLSQKLIAEAIIRGGGDIIIGNHPFYSQDMEQIQGKPVFYGLGDSTSSYIKETCFFAV